MTEGKPRFITHPGVALLWVPALGGAPARAPGGCVFEEQVGVGVHNARVSEKHRCLMYSGGREVEFLPGYARYM